MRKSFKAVLPLSAYPFHLGHFSLFNQAQNIFGEGKVLLLVSYNSNKQYNYDRMECFSRPEVYIPAVLNTDLVAQYCMKHNIHFIVRGVRNSKDFEYEKDMADFNARFGLQTLLLPPWKGTEGISGTAIRELLKYGQFEMAASMCPGFVRPDLRKLCDGNNTRPD